MPKPSPSRSRSRPSANPSVSAKARGHRAKKDRAAERLIADRLREFQRAIGEGTQEGFAARIGVPRNTVTSWFRTRTKKDAKDGPRTPSAEALMAMARNGRLNLNWLLLGEGPKLREATAELGPSVDALLAYVRAEGLASFGETSRADLDAFVAMVKRRPEHLLLRMYEWMQEWMERRMEYLQAKLDASERAQIQSFVKRLTTGDIPSSTEAETMLESLSATAQSRVNAASALADVRERRQRRTHSHPQSGAEPESAVP
jgi:hypothetical protein